MDRCGRPAPDGIRHEGHHRPEQPFAAQATCISPLPERATSKRSNACCFPFGWTAPRGRASMPGGRSSLCEERARDDEAHFARPCFGLGTRRGVDHVADEDDLLPLVANLTCDDAPTVDPGTKGGHRAVRALVAAACSLYRIDDGEVASEATSVRARVRQRPRHDDLVPDVLVHIATVLEYRLLEVLDEVTQERVIAQMADLLGNRGRARPGSRPSRRRARSP